MARQECVYFGKYIRRKISTLSHFEGKDEKRNKKRVEI